MGERGELLRLAGLIVPLAGVVEATEDPFEPFRLVDPAGDPVLPVMEFLADLQAGGRAPATQRSYAMPLLRWFRFLWAVEVPAVRESVTLAGRAERARVAREFVGGVLGPGHPCVDVAVCREPTYMSSASWAVPRS